MKAFQAEGLILAKHFRGGVGRKMQFGPERVWYSITFFFFFWNNTTVQPPFLNLDWAWNLLYPAKLTVCQFRVYALRGLSFVCMRALNGQIRKSNYLAEEITWRVHLEIEKGPETTWGEIEGGSYELNSSFQSTSQVKSVTFRTIVRPAELSSWAQCRLRIEWLFFRILLFGLAYYAAI